MVGRPRQFDEDQVLEKAMSAFWAHGYETTSMLDLVSATGLHKGSLYQAFGNKHDLFVKSLRRYLEEMRLEKSRLLKEADSPLAGIYAVLHGMVEISDDDDGCPKGCLAVNSLVELAPHDLEVGSVMNEHTNQMLTSMTQVVSEAQALGQISDARPADLICMLMMTFMSGLATLIKGPIDKAQAHQLLDAELKALI
ncbi:MAG TPA: hypothetical protein DCM54_17170 [Gammaproteobacteria bacterium]|nr:hypothetical protein [Gammaproteobacteria bacterium]